MGYLKIAFTWAFKYLKVNKSFDEAMADILLRDGDTDTNAAIVGGLLGARGINNISKDWIHKVMTFDPTIKEVRKRQRPEFLSPKHHLVHLTKEIYFNLPSTLKFIMNRKEFEMESLAMLH